MDHLAGGSRGTHVIVGDWRENCEEEKPTTTCPPFPQPYPSSRAGRDHQGSWTQREGWQDLQQRRSPGGPDNHRHITRFHKSSPPAKSSIAPWTSPALQPQGPPPCLLLPNLPRSRGGAISLGEGWGRRRNLVSGLASPPPAAICACKFATANCFIKPTMLL